MIDFHTYPIMIKELTDSDHLLAQNIHDILGFHFPSQPLDCFLRELTEAGIDKAVILPLDCTTAHDCIIVSNEQIADLVQCSERLIGFASVDPLQAKAPSKLHEAICRLGLRGLNLDPAVQRFYPNDPVHAYPIYQVCADLEIPAFIQCGMSWAPSGLAKYSQPLLLEEAVQSFPSVNFILGHFGWPWILDGAMLALKYPNVYVDTAILFSGPPKDAYRHALIEHVGLDVIERSLFQKILFGSSYPRIDVRRSVRGLRSLGLSLAAEKAILGANASHLLFQKDGK